ncbi:MAG: transcription elongation factor subunit Spt4 [Candidatus Kariarchaeaceae archaeon]|jgi:DNA-directed RNA polymerase subunit E"
MKACRKCRRILKDEEIQKDVSIRCPVCNSTDLSEDFSGRVIILRPDESEIAKKLGVKEPGSYALRVR